MDFGSCNVSDLTPASARFLAVGRTCQSGVRAGRRTKQGFASTRRMSHAPISMPTPLQPDSRTLLACGHRTHKTDRPESERAKSSEASPGFLTRAATSTAPPQQVEGHAAARPTRSVPATCSTWRPCAIQARGGAQCAEGEQELGHLRRPPSHRPACGAWRHGPARKAAGCRVLHRYPSASARPSDTLRLRSCQPSPMPRVLSRFFPSLTPGLIFPPLRPHQLLGHSRSPPPLLLPTPLSSSPGALSAAALFCQVGREQRGLREESQGALAARPRASGVAGTFTDEVSATRHPISSRRRGARSLSGMSVLAPPGGRARSSHCEFNGSQNTIAELQCASHGAARSRRDASAREIAPRAQAPVLEESRWKSERRSAGVSHGGLPVPPAEENQK